MNARDEYRSILDGILERLRQLDRSLQTLVWLRTGLFFTGLALFVFGYGGAIAPMLTRPLAWLSAAGFLVAIVWNENLRLRLESLLSDQKFFERLIARMDRNWRVIPQQHFFDDVDPPMSRDDLDIDGESSLLSLISLAATPPGTRCLQQWVSTVPSWSEIAVRQTAVKSLSPLRSLRLNILRKLISSNFGANTPYGLAEWAESPSWLTRHPMAAALSWLCPALVIVGGMLLMLAPATSSWHVPVLGTLANLGFAMLAAGMLSNILVTVLWGSWIHGIFAKVCGHHRCASEYAEVFEWTKQLPHDEGLLDQIRCVCTEQPASATQGFRRLNQLVRLASFQKNVILYLVYLVLQLTLLWDIHVLRLLERWKKQYGGNAREWFEALGTCESIISVATLADENPEWSFPEIGDEPDVAIEAKGIAHPLLPNNQRVANDLRLSRSKPILLVTGSNMAGKSTFLRAVGINIMLARTGSPVCASLMKMQPFEIASSIRVRDSLREGISFFMAELQRLKSVVDLARKHSTPGQPPLLFLLDEILQGTNSRERQIAVTGVIEQLIEFGACGLLSTHDLDLADVPSMAAISQIVHFREFFETGPDGKQSMRFDYVMRPGVTPTTNALKLLQLVGLCNPERKETESVDSRETSATSQASASVTPGQGADSC
jgi:hypothetical protein